MLQNFLALLCFALSLSSYAALPAATIQTILKKCSTGLHEYAITPLVGGYSGAALYKMQTSSSTLVVRQLPAKTPLNDVLRLIELTTLAAQSGTSPRVYLTDLPQKIIVTEYVPGTITHSTTLSPKDIQQLGKTLKKFHSAGLPTYESDPIRRFESYLRNIPSSKLPSSFQEVRDFINVFRLLREQYQQKGFIHTDLHSMNILHERDQFWIIDLEDSGLGDIYFDLGQVIKNFLLTEEQALIFLQGYFVSVTPQQQSYVYLNTQLAHALYAAWGLCHGLTAIESTEQLDGLLQHYDDENSNEFVKEVHCGATVLKTAEDKLKYGLINLSLFLKEAKSGALQTSIDFLKNRP